MKHQYTGDVNDFCKYGLLRALTEQGQRRATVAWSLTPDDDSADGRKLGYLNSPNRWRRRDPELFDALRLIVSGGQPRAVAAVEAAGVVFFLAAQPEADVHYRSRAQAIAATWRDAIEVRWVELGG